MKENKIKELIEKSKLETSPDFTDKLLLKLVFKQEVKKTVDWPFRTIFTVTTVIIVALSYALFEFFDSSLKILNVRLDDLKIPMFLIFSILFLLSINYIIRLNETHKKLKKETLSF